MSNEQQGICGFWRRLGALVLDVLLLGVVGFLLGLFFSEQFIALGSWGRWLGFIIELGYFGLLNSRLGNGQTLGKRLLKIRVVDGANQLLSLPRAMVRAAILAMPFALNGIDPGGLATNLYLMVPLSVLLFGGLFSIIYLYLFNRSTRQSLHDLAVGSFVVNAASLASDSEREPIWPWHLRLVGLILIVAAAVPFFTLNLAQTPLFRNLLATQQLLQQEPDVTRAAITIAAQKTLVGTEAGHDSGSFITAQIFLTQNRLQDAALAKRLASRIVTSLPDANEVDAIQIMLVQGYDIGVFSRWTTQGYSFSPAQLRGVSSALGQ